MLHIEIIGGIIRCIFAGETPGIAREVWERIEETVGIKQDEYYIIHNGRLMHEDDICHGYMTIVPRTLGGKGGFGSMLRAIGAQIEKTTNREACRDLSGRRLRDINEEKRLKAWIEKEVKRKEEIAELKKKKLEKLCAEPRHEFKDHRYEQERSKLTERVGDAVEEGFKVSVTTGVKRKLEEDVKPNKRKTMLDLDIDSDELDTSDDSDSDNMSSTKESKMTQQTLNDSGHSSDDSGEVDKSTTIQSKHSITQTDNHPNKTVPFIEPANTKYIDEAVENLKQKSVDSRTETAL
ncbi:replication stress response regulator SDE2 [Odontomachus brunneus]|uniref:replication stress response regulator SDE2 n=1 Tax=Odontomachus brunneus TaxID=486640 RepID=UPI0013F1B93A|nr:replication stress response regulator SDE2 [Odontomachus brunneus]